MNNIIIIIGAIIAVILGLFGIEKHKNKKLGEKLEQEEQKSATLEIQTEIYKANQEATVEAVQAQDEQKESQEKEEQEIEKAQTNEEVIAIANDIVDSFNKL